MSDYRSNRSPSYSTESLRLERCQLGSLKNFKTNETCNNKKKEYLTKIHSKYNNPVRLNDNKCKAAKTVYQVDLKSKPTYDLFNVNILQIADHMKDR